MIRLNILPGTGRGGVLIVFFLLGRTFFLGVVELWFPVFIH